MIRQKGTIKRAGVVGHRYRLASYPYLRFVRVSMQCVPIPVDVKTESAFLTVSNASISRNSIETISKASLAFKRTVRLSRFVKLKLFPSFRFVQ